MPNSVNPRATEMQLSNISTAQAARNHGDFRTIEDRPPVKTGKPIRAIIIGVVVALVVIVPLIAVLVVVTRQNSSKSEETSSTAMTIRANTTTVTTATTTSSTTSSSTSVTTTSVTTTTTTSSTTTVTTTTHVIDQCNLPQTVGDASRLTTAAQGTVCDTNIFDSTLRWARFVPPGGTQITTTPTSWNGCGTMATEWINATLPSTGVTINATACFTAFGNICYWSTVSQITNCGSFYVFGLYAPPGCDARYCTVCFSSE